jgi:uncharacterized protein (TIGR01244 family)
MDIRHITDDFFAAPQICAEDLPDIAAAGIVKVVCNRPDSEVPPGQRSDVIAAAAQAAGIAFAVQPLTHQTMTPDVIRANRAHMEGADGPVLAYCASGTRSTIAWALGMAGTWPASQIVEAAAKGGYDLRNLQPTLEAIAQANASG